MTVLNQVQKAIAVYNKTAWFNSPAMIALESYLAAIKKNNANQNKLTVTQALEIKRIFIDLYPVPKRKTAAYAAWLSIIKAIDLGANATDADAKTIADFYEENKKRDTEESFTLSDGSTNAFQSFKKQDDFDSNHVNQGFVFRKTLQTEISRYHGVRGGKPNPAIIALEDFANSTASATIAEVDSQIEHQISATQQATVANIFTKAHPVKKSNKSYTTWLSLISNFFKGFSVTEPKAIHDKLRTAAKKKKKAADLTIDDITTALNPDPPVANSGATTSYSWDCFGWFKKSYAKLATDDVTAIAIENPNGAAIPVVSLELILKTVNAFQDWNNNPRENLQAALAPSFSPGINYEVTLDELRAIKIKLSDDVKFSTVLTALSDRLTPMLQQHLALTTIDLLAENPIELTKLLVSAPKENTLNEDRAILISQIPVAKSAELLTELESWYPAHKALPDTILNALSVKLTDGTLIKVDNVNQGFRIRLAEAYVEKNKLFAAYRLAPNTTSGKLDCINAEKFTDLLAPLTTEKIAHLDCNFKFSLLLICFKFSTQEDFKTNLQKILDNSSVNVIDLIEYAMVALNLNEAQKETLSQVLSVYLEQVVKADFGLTINPSFSKESIRALAAVIIPENAHDEVKRILLIQSVRAEDSVKLFKQLEAWYPQAIPASILGALAAKHEAGTLTIAINNNQNFRQRLITEYLEKNELFNAYRFAPNTVIETVCGFNGEAKLSQLLAPNDISKISLEHKAVLFTRCFELETHQQLKTNLAKLLTPPVNTLSIMGLIEKAKVELELNEDQLAVISQKMLGTMRPGIIYGKQYAAEQSDKVQIFGADSTYQYQFPKKSAAFFHLARVHEDVQAEIMGAPDVASDKLSLATKQAFFTLTKTAPSLISMQELPRLAKLLAVGSEQQVSLLAAFDVREYLQTMPLTAFNAGRVTKSSESKSTSPGFFGTPEKATEVETVVAKKDKINLENDFTANMNTLPIECQEKILTYLVSLKDNKDKQKIPFVDDLRVQTNTGFMGKASTRLDDLVDKHQKSITSRSTQTCPR